MPTCPRWLRRRLPVLLATFVGGALLAALFLLLSARPSMTHAAAPFQSCDLINQYYTRTIQIWYGSLRQDSQVITDAVELTDRVTAQFALLIATNGDTDARVAAGVSSWVITVTDMQWVLGVPENLPAESRLRGRLASSAPVQFAPVVRHDDQIYALAAWTTFEEAPECSPLLQQIDHEGYGVAEMYELNANIAPTSTPTATPTETATATPTSTPTPTSPFRAYLPLLVR